MIPPIRFLLTGLLFMSFAFSLVRPGIFRFAVFSTGLGCALGSSLIFINNLKGHSFKAVSEQICILDPPIDFKIISSKIFEHLSEDYNELGQLEIGEENITVKPNVFAQIGIIDIDGIRKMWSSVIIPNLRMYLNKSGILKEVGNLTKNIEEETVFCDIGSGIGNVCLQILAETKCKKVIGVEVIPSRHRNADIAFSKARTYYPDIFNNKKALFIQEDFVNCTSRLVEEKVNVIFTHSWMFDDEVIKKLTEVITSVPSILCVITSRKLNKEILVNSPLKLVSKVYFSSDWNDQAPFYVYVKQV